MIWGAWVIHCQLSYSIANKLVKTSRCIATSGDVRFLWKLDQDIQTNRISFTEVYMPLLIQFSLSMQNWLKQLASSTEARTWLNCKTSCSIYMRLQNWTWEYTKRLLPSSKQVLCMKESEFMAVQLSILSWWSFLEDTCTTSYCYFCVKRFNQSQPAWHDANVKSRSSWGVRSLQIEKFQALVACFSGGASRSSCWDACSRIWHGRLDIWTSSHLLDSSSWTSVLSYAPVDSSVTNFDDSWRAAWSSSSNSLKYCMKNGIYSAYFTGLTFKYHTYCPQILKTEYAYERCQSTMLLSA